MITEHKPISAKGSPTPRIQNWALTLQPYDFNVTYEPGITNASDVLSHSPVEPADNTEYHTNDAEYFINSIIIDATPNAVTIK